MAKNLERFLWPPENIVCGTRIQIQMVICSWENCRGEIVWRRQRDFEYFREIQLGEKMTINKASAIYKIVSVSVSVSITISV